MAARAHVMPKSVAATPSERDTHPKPNTRVPRYMVRTARPMLVRVPRTYSAWRLGTRCPAPQVRTARRRLIRVSRTYSTEAPGRTCKLRATPLYGGPKSILAEASKLVPGLGLG
eukprot:scaffold38602_cov69-Phaeocystis_antarctica.AAC.4